MKTGKTQNFIGYIRVSTSTQAKKGQSLECQKDAIEQYCSVYGYNLVKIYEDRGKSARNLNREGFKSALEMLKSKNIDGLIVFSLSRLSRNSMDTLTLVEKVFQKKELHSIKEKIDLNSAMGKAMLTMQSAFAQLDSDNKGELIALGKESKRKKGGYIGGKLPLGWIQDEGELVPNEDEQELIEEVRAYRLHDFSYVKIAKRFNDLGRYNERSKTGNWSKQVIMRLDKSLTIDEMNEMKAGN
jgi:site-specific DNA recombinase